MRFTSIIAIAIAVRLNADADEQLTKLDLKKMFKACDADSNGLVTLEEGAACAKKAGLSGKKLARAGKIFKKIAGKDGKLSLKELKAAAKKWAKKNVELDEEEDIEEEEQEDKIDGKAIWKLCNTNNDKFVTPEEATACAPKLGLKGAALKKASALFNKNVGKDGKLSMAEFKRGLKKYKKWAKKNQKAVEIDEEEDILADEDKASKKEIMAAVVKGFKSCDSNGDKVVTGKEALACAKKYGLTGKKLAFAKKVFKKVAGEDGKLSLKELTTAAKKWLKKNYK